MSRSKKATVTKRASKDTLSRRRQVQLVIPLGNGWIVKSANTTKFTVITDSKKDAIAIATSIAKTKKTDLVIYNKDGRIGTTKSFAASA